MPPALSPRAAAYLGAVALQIEKKLQRALASASQSRSFLKELFTDIALEVDDRAKDIIFDEEDVVYVAEDRNGCALCFYDVLADYFVCMPQNGESIIDLIVQLWSQSFASNIFCLLFHKRMFEVQFDDPDVILRYSSALVQGARNVFWIDIQTNTRRFLSLFHYLLEEVAFRTERLKMISPQAQNDLFLLLSSFLFYYDSADKLDPFLKQFPVFPNAFLVGGPPDIFVTEVADLVCECYQLSDVIVYKIYPSQSRAVHLSSSFFYQLQKLKVEPVLLHYLSCLEALQGLELRLATSTRLKTCLYSFTSPGGPMYPTRAVRHAAWDALNSLFPVGRYPRHIISLFFRLLYPWYWPSSCWNFILSCIRAVFFYIFGFVFSLWETHTLSKPQ